MDVRPDMVQLYQKAMKMKVDTGLFGLHKAYDGWAYWLSQISNDDYRRHERSSVDSNQTQAKADVCGATAAGHRQRRRSLHDRPHSSRNKEGTFEGSVHTHDDDGHHSRQQLQQPEKAPAWSHQSHYNTREEPSDYQAMQNMVANACVKNAALPDGLSAGDNIGKSDAACDIPSVHRSRRKRPGSAVRRSDEDASVAHSDPTIDLTQEATIATAETDQCAICLGPLTDKVKMTKCKHTFCRVCIDDSFKKFQPKCPICLTVYGTCRGPQPENGTMHHSTIGHSLPGHNNCGTIMITYNFPSGTQSVRCWH